MDPLTVILTVLATKALEKTGENLGDALTERVGKFWSVLKHESPDTASAIELAPEQPLDYGQAMLKVQSVADRNDEFKQILIQLLAAAQADPNPRLGEDIQAEMKKLQSQQPSIQNLNRSKLQEKGVINQGNIDNQTNHF
jgi:hypothetical protein